MVEIETLNDNICFLDTYRNKKVLVTGNTGFKGSWLCVWLSILGAKISGISNGIPTSPSHFESLQLKSEIDCYDEDVRDLCKVKEVIDKFKPDFIFHLAAQPLVRESYSDPVTTIETNVMGTMNVLEALRQANHKCTAIMITSDKCYDNVEWLWGYRETDHLGGKDPYSASKGAAELIIKTYSDSFFDKDESNVKVASVRAGNVIGGGDWAKDRIVPDCIRSWSSDRVVEIRSPNATRPWQHVLEPLSGYLLLGQILANDRDLNGEPFNFGPNANQNFTVKELVSRMQRYWSGTKVNYAENSDRSKKESGLLKLCCDKALHQLGWQPTLTFDETARFTVEWYRNFYSEKKDVYEMSSKQVEEYIQKASERGQIWVNSC
ncbi:CDP-glucose 4,6-dehydratase [Methanolobus sp.]|jgi:CDP-glucose 4,6-dehydratase|uniref:CDP-glucose 4,6-dehydratase n=1 Tax=Methanolobus sp. TaxID=1874737 RepID=UPI0025EA3DA6|nr:CDP-glucose 4,6-dehydratase [Methanolobus sp.]